MSIDARVLFDPSAYELFARCEEEFVERDVHGITVPGVSPATLFGGAVHAGLRALYDGQSADAAAACVRESWGENPPVFLSPRAKKGHDLTAVVSPVLEVTRTAATLTGAVSSEKERDLISRGFFSAVNGPVPPENRLEVIPSIEAVRWPEPTPAGSAAPVPFPTLRFKYDSTELTDESLALLDQVVLAPYQFLWLMAK